MRARALFEATVGRRLLVRIWAHGMLLFVGVIVIVTTARHVMSDIDASMVIRSRPYLARAVAERVLAQRGDPGALARELAIVEAETALAVAVYEPGGRLLGSSSEPPLAPPAEAECRAGNPAWSAGRIVAAAGGACAVVAAPGLPSVPWHAAALLVSALLLGFVCVAAPLTHSIVRPLERLGTLARELGAGNLAVRAAVDRHDEIGELARSFNVMAGQLQRLRAAERELLGDVSHELRTPLARMRVVLDLACDAEPDRVRRYLGEITTDLGELEHLIDDIIGASRLEADAARWEEARPPLRRTRLAIDELAGAAIARFRERWPARTLVYEPAGEPLVVDADPALLRRALDNLLDNARKYSDDSAPVTLRAVRDAAGVRIEVADRGCGIAEADRDRVFSAFYRADRSRTRSSGGVGLGLALARRIVEAHGGTIGFASELDRGSQFWFVLALA